MEVRKEGVSTSFDQARIYISRQASSPARYVLEAVVTTLFGRIPTIAGIALRSIVYRLILGMDGMAAIENGVRLRFASNIRLGAGVYLDEGTYLHACPNGIAIGAGSFVMHGAILHVYNFRAIPHSGIRIGLDSLVGERCVLRGQGGIDIGDRVYLAPGVQILAVDHVFDDPDQPFTAQGITARGVWIDDDVWIGAGAIITDGVKLGRGCVVAAGAVVTADVAPHALVGGVPARVIEDIREAAEARRAAAGRSNGAAVRAVAPRW